METDLRKFCVHLKSFREACSGADKSISWYRRPPTHARVEWIAWSPVWSGAHSKQVNCLINSLSQLEVLLVNMLSSDVHSWLIAHLSLVPWVSHRAARRSCSVWWPNFPAAALECPWRKGTVVFIGDCLWPLKVHCSATVVISTIECDFIHIRLFVTGKEFGSHRFIVCTVWEMRESNLEKTDLSYYFINFLNFYHSQLHGDDIG